MASSLLSPNPVVNSDGSVSGRKRKKKHDKERKNRAENLSNLPAIQWKSEVQQQIYSSKLFHALRQLRMSSSGALGEQAPPSKRVRDTACRVLATTAKGRSGWSRAILTGWPKLNSRKKNNLAKRQRKLMAVVITTTGKSRLQKKSKISVPSLKSKGLPAFQRKARLLSRLIPGCRKQPFQVVLEEAIDYIPALEMQVRVMSALVERLSTSVSSSNGSTMASTDQFGQPGLSRSASN